MAKTLRKAAVRAPMTAAFLAVGQLAWAAQDGAAEAPTTPSGVRTFNAMLRGVIGHAIEASPTFRRLVHTIQASDGIVYVEPGRCGGRARACMAHRVTMAGRNRILRIFVDVRMGQRELISHVAHELQHAIEVLDNPTITTDVAVTRFYLYRGLRLRAKGAFETQEAIDVGNAVRDELGRMRRN